MLLETLCSILLVAVSGTATQTTDADPLNVQPPLGHDGTSSTYFSKVDGADRTATVEKSMLSSSPRWLPEDPVPALPLSLAEAAQAARALLASTVREPSKWGMEQVALERFGLSCLYVVRWKRIAGGTNDFLQIPVLMTGRAIPLDPLEEHHK